MEGSGSGRPALLEPNKDYKYLHHQQLLTDLACQSPGCWLIPSGNNELWFPSTAQTQWQRGAEHTADSFSHEAEGGITLWNDTLGGSFSLPACTAVPSSNSPCWLNSVSITTGVNKEAKKYTLQKPCDVAFGCEAMPEPSGQSQRCPLDLQAKCRYISFPDSMLRFEFDATHATKNAA